MGAGVTASSARAVRLPRLAACALLVAIAACNAADRAERDYRSAEAAYRSGDLAQALEIVDRGLVVVRAKPDSPIARRLRLLKAELLIEQRKGQEAKTLVDADIPDGAEFSVARARQAFLRARLTFSGGRLEDALAQCEQADRLAPRDQSVSFEIGNLAGQILFQLGRFGDAEKRLTDIVSRAGRAGDGYFEAFALHQLGMGQLVRSRFDEGVALFEKELASPAVRPTALYVKALANAGTCYSRLGQFDRATVLQRRAVDFAKSRATSRDYEQALGQLGNTYILQGRSDEGLTYMQQAFATASAAGLSADATLWAKNLAAAYVDLQDWDQAERFNEEAKHLWDNTRSGRPVYNTLTSAEIALGRGRFDEAGRLFGEAAATADAPPSVLWDAHYGLAKVAVASGDHGRAVKEFDATLGIVEHTRAGLLRTDYKLSYLTQLITFYRSYVTALVAQKQFERALEVADSSRARVLAERQRAAASSRVDAAAVRQIAARRQVVFLSYWLAPQSSDLWIVTGRGTRHVELPGSPDIESLVREHQAAMTNALTDPLAEGSPGDRLFRMLVSPAAKEIPQGTDVVIVPDGALHGVNFETLPVDGATRHYWIEDVEIQVAPSLAGIATPTHASSGPETVLIIGDAVSRPPEFPRLKFAGVEMKKVADHFDAGRVTTISQERATPLAYRGAEPGRFSYVHFAAHATANRDSPLDSAVILSGSDESYKLYARDVAALPLSADLVTVSACRSAGERAYSGEGLVGFAWAFLRAGARRVVAGLWDVDDQSTADLMDRLYAGIAKGERPSSALREAKLALARQGARPFAWGAFQLFTVVP